MSYRHEVEMSSRCKCSAKFLFKDSHRQSLVFLYYQSFFFNVSNKNYLYANNIYTYVFSLVNFIYYEFTILILSLATAGFTYFKAIALFIIVYFNSLTHNTRNTDLRVLILERSPRPTFVIVKLIVKYYFLCQLTIATLVQ